MSMQEQLNNCLGSLHSSRGKLSRYSGKYSTSLSTDSKNGVAYKKRKSKVKRKPHTKVKPYLFKFLADECECLKNGICWSCDCDDAFRA
jgi:hypothetical protein